MGLGLMLYMIFMFSLDMQEDMSELSYTIFFVLGFVMTILIVVPTKKEIEDDV